MKVEDFIKTIGAEFFTGVPDSQLKALCNYLMATYGADGKHHIIAANEGNCTAIAAGYHLATGKVPLIYMQNSGEGNMINPLASLMNDKVYAIPAIFVIGWRGEPGVYDEPQHVFQGEVTIKLLELMDIDVCIVSKNTTKLDIECAMTEFNKKLDAGKQVAFVVRKGALEFDGQEKYANTYTMKREDIIKHITAVTQDDLIVSTTGKASRELFEIREAEKQSHGYDFLTVGSMGHSSSVALGIALQKSEKKLWIIDGDGAVLMHMGAMAVIGAYKPKNIVHIVINNNAHETVGGQPTVMKNIDIAMVARACGYPYAVSVDSYEKLDEALKTAKSRNELSFIEVKSAIGARNDLGRPTTTAKDNKKAFMDTLRLQDKIGSMSIVGGEQKRRP